MGETAKYCPFRLLARYTGLKQGRIQPVVWGGGEQLIGPHQTLPTPKLGFLLGFRSLYFGNAQK